MKLSRAVVERINQLLQEQHLSRYALCRKIGLHEATLHRILHEQHESCTIKTLASIADGFDLSLEEFFADPIFNRGNLDLD